MPGQPHRALLQRLVFYRHDSAVQAMHDAGVHARDRHHYLNQVLTTYDSINNGRGQQTCTQPAPRLNSTRHNSTHACHEDYCQQSPPLILMWVIAAMLLTSWPPCRPLVLSRSLFRNTQPSSSRPRLSLPYFSMSLSHAAPLQARSPIGAKCQCQHASSSFGDTKHCASRCYWFPLAD
jgi:hypothetical protein